METKLTECEIVREAGRELLAALGQSLNSTDLTREEAEGRLSLFVADLGDELERAAGVRPTRSPVQDFTPEKKRGRKRKDHRPPVNPFLETYP